MIVQEGWDAGKSTVLHLAGARSSTFARFGVVFDRLACKRFFREGLMRFLTPAAIFLMFTTTLLGACAAFAEQASSIPDSRLMQPADLAGILNARSGEKPLVIQVGFHILYTQGHIPGAEYLGPASRPEGLEQLRKRVASLPRDKFIVIYCGCCPWTHCPNVHPSAELLQSMGFTRFKVLYIADNFGTDWVKKGYPTAKGE
jgi:hypothetical protein